MRIIVSISFIPKLQTGCKRYDMMEEGKGRGKIFRPETTSFFKKKGGKMGDVDATLVVVKVWDIMRIV